MHVQELLSAQQQLSEGYRHEARQAIDRLAQMEAAGPTTQHRRLKREQAAAESM